MITKIVITKDGAQSSVTGDQWKSMPLPERIGLIGKSAVKFYNGAAEVPPRDALNLLKA